MLPPAARSPSLSQVAPGPGLLDALEIRGAGRVVSLVGAGGKTSLALWLMAEGRERGWPTLFTTTTHIQEPVLGEGECLLLCEAPGFWGELARCVRQGAPTFVAAGLSGLQASGDSGHPILPGRFRSRKLRGLALAEVDRLVACFPEALVLVEADGARHRLLKAPAEYEPQIPESTTHLAVVAAADVVGKPLAPDVVHRPEHMAALLGVNEGTTLTPHLVAEALAHPDCGLKGIPAGPCAILILTFLAEPWPVEVAREVAERALAISSRFRRVVLCALRPSWGVVGVLGR